jgi:hypothetical protein
MCLKRKKYSKLTIIDTNDNSEHKKNMKNYFFPSGFVKIIK